MKEGDKVYCHTSIIKAHNCWFRKGKTYEIIKISKNYNMPVFITFIDEENDENSILLSEYNKNFLLPKEFRKLKLDILNSL